MLATIEMFDIDEKEPSLGDFVFFIVPKENTYFTVCGSYVGNKEFISLVGMLDTGRPLKNIKYWSRMIIMLNLEDDKS